MSTDRGGVAGFRLTGRTWADDLGIWSSAVAADGRPGSALRFDPRLVADPAARERLVAAVLADRRLAQSGMTGLIPVADLITARDEVWLITSEPTGPTVGDLLSPGSPGSPRPDAGSAATVLVETAQALLAVHASGLAHGELHPGTVVIAPDGSALLAERGSPTPCSAALPRRNVTWRPGRRSPGGWRRPGPRATAGPPGCWRGRRRRPPSEGSLPRATRCSPGATSCRPDSPPATGSWRPCTGGRRTTRPPRAGIRPPRGPPPTRGRSSPCCTSRGPVIRTHRGPATGAGPRM